MKRKIVLTKKDILHLAKLAKLTLSEEEVDKYFNQLEETVEYVDNLNQIDTDKVKPTSHTSNSKNIFFADGEKDTRIFTAERAVKNAKNKKNNYFIVPRIM